MAAVEEPASPPAAKRARLDPDTQFSTLPPSPSNGHSDANGATSSTAHMPSVTSAPDLTEPTKRNEDYESDEEDVPEQPVAEEEDLSRADMYLDTVSPLKRSDDETDQ
jgi:U4/U6.U5 tri-snRNP-associated protein 2